VVITETFEIAITYCDGNVFVHKHDTAAEAVEEYAQMLVAGIVPELGQHPKARHVRLVTLIGRDELGDLIHNVDSGVFACEHQR